VNRPYVAIDGGSMLTVVGERLIDHDDCLTPAMV
jgi:hypothetical protein